MRYTIIILGLLLLQSATTYSQSRTNVILPDPNPFQEMVPVDFCEVIQNAHRYDGKVIRVRAIFDQQMESAALLPYDSKNCSWQSMRPDFECSSDSKCAQLSLRLRKSLNGRPTGRGAVLLQGRFVYRRLLTYREARLGFRPYELRISKVEEILKLPQDGAEK
jgi:hypothetical protein